LFAWFTREDDEFTEEITQELLLIPEFSQNKSLRKFVRQEIENRILNGWKANNGSKGKRKWTEFVGTELDVIHETFCTVLSFNSIWKESVVLKVNQY